MLSEGRVVTSGSLEGVGRCHSYDIIWLRYLVYIYNTNKYLVTRNESALYFNYVASTLWNIKATLGFSPSLAKKCSVTPVVIILLQQPRTPHLCLYIKTLHHTLSTPTTNTILPNPVLYVYGYDIYHSQVERFPPPPPPPPTPPPPTVRHINTVKVSEGRCRWWREWRPGGIHSPLQYGGRRCVVTSDTRRHLIYRCRGWRWRPFVNCNIETAMAAVMVPTIPRGGDSGRTTDTDFNVHQGRLTVTWMTLRVRAIPLPVTFPAITAVKRSHCRLPSLIRLNCSCLSTCVVCLARTLIIRHQTSFINIKQMGGGIKDVRMHSGR